MFVAHDLLTTKFEKLCDIMSSVDVCLDESGGHLHNLVNPVHGWEKLLEEMGPGEVNIRKLLRRLKITEATQSNIVKLLQHLKIFTLKFKARFDITAGGTTLYVPRPLSPQFLVSCPDNDASFRCMHMMRPDLSGSLVITGEHNYC